MGLAIALMLAAGSAESPGWLVWRTGNELLDECTSRTELLIGSCTGYILAVSDTTMSISGSKLIVGFNLPAQSNPKQLRDIVVKYLTDHPELRHQDASGLVFASLNAAFGKKP